MTRRSPKTTSPSASALPPGYTKGKLYTLWRNSRRRNPEAQLELLRVVKLHPSAESWLQFFAAEWDQRQADRAELTGKQPAKPLGPWERNALHAREGGRWVRLIPGGNPSSGKRRP